MAAHASTSGLLLLLQSMNTTAHVHVLQAPINNIHVLTYLHSLAMTTAVSVKVLTLSPTMIGCGMARTAQLLFENAVTRAPGSVRTFRNQLLTILRSGCAVMRPGAMRTCTLNTLSSRLVMAVHRVRLHIT